MQLRHHLERDLGAGYSQHDLYLRTGKSYDFNTATKLNSLLVKVLKNTGQLVAGESYDLDFDHQVIETEKYDAKMTYKKFTGYSPGVAVIGDLIVGIENRDGNANVSFHQQDTLERIYSNLESENIHIKRSRMDCGSCSREIVETVEKHSEHFYIRTNRCGSLYDSLLALRGWQREEINSIEYELNSIIVEKWEGKVYRLSYSASDGWTVSRTYGKESTLTAAS